MSNTIKSRVQIKMETFDVGDVMFVWVLGSLGLWVLFWVLGVLGPWGFGTLGHPWVLGYLGPWILSWIRGSMGPWVCVLVYLCPWVLES